MFDRYYGSDLKQMHEIPRGNSKGRSERSLWNESVQTGGAGGQE